MSSKFESLKQKNAAAIQQMEKATNLTIVDSKMWEKLIELQQTQCDQLTAIFNEITYKAEETSLQDVKGVLEKQKTAIESAAKSSSEKMERSISDQTEALSKQVGRQNEQFGFQMNNLSETTSEIRKKLLPLLIGIPTAVQVLFLTAYILLEIFLK